MLQEINNEALCRPLSPSQEPPHSGLKGQHREGVAQGSLPTGAAVSEGVAPLPSHPDPPLLYLSQEGPGLTQCTSMCTFSTLSTEREEQIGT